MESEAVAGVFSVIGDSNVQRNLLDYNCSGREDMKSAQLIPCTSFAVFAACLAKIRPETNILILSCLSNFLRDSDSAADPGELVIVVLLIVFVSSFPLMWSLNIS